VSHASSRRSSGRRPWQAAPGGCRGRAKGVAGEASGGGEAPGGDVGIS
jgi:hypothetical protein